jgi:hypothetical protein
MTRKLIPTAAFDPTCNRKLVQPLWYSWIYFLSYKMQCWKITTAYAETGFCACGVNADVDAMLLLFAAAVMELCEAHALRHASGKYATQKTHCAFRGIFPTG